TARIWNKYFDQLIDNIHWYTQASDPFIKRVQQPGWNEYMNMVREWDVRRAILNLYTDWGSEIMAVNGNSAVVGIVVAHPVLNCHTDMPMMGGGADPFAKKTGKLKTFAGKCYKEPSSFDAWVVSYEDDCDKTKISVTIGAAKVFKEWDYSKKFKEDDTYRTGLTIGVSKSVKMSGSAGGVSASGGVNVGADVTFYSEYYSNTDARKGSGITLDLSASVGASASVQLPGGGFGDMASDLVNSNVSKPKIGAGVGATVEIYANAGPDGSLGAFNVTSVNIQKK
ncbi:MAG TPA: hypothetical protein VK543_00920, partial [Puia sp.]|nr:hypothetical protein [Puia sp.]